MTTTSADKTLATAFLHDFRCVEDQACEKLIRYVSPDHAFEVVVEQKSGHDYAVEIEVYKGASPVSGLFSRAKMFASLLQ